jgi:hypothetical protein
MLKGYFEVRIFVGASSGRDSRPDDGNFDQP